MNDAIYYGSQVSTAPNHQPTHGQLTIAQMHLASTPHFHCRDPTKPQPFHVSIKPWRASANALPRPTTLLLVLSLGTLVHGVVDLLIRESRDDSN